MAITINGTSGISGVDGSAATPALQGTDTNTGISFGSDVIIGSTGGVERWRTDSSGRVLVGTSSARTNVREGTDNETPKVQFESAINDYSEAGLSIINNSSSGFAPQLWLGRSASDSIGGNALVSSGRIGSISFNAADGTNFIQGARIQADIDGTSGSGDLPTRLVFSVCKDGSASPSEAARINNSGALKASSNGQTYVSSTNVFHELIGNHAGEATVILKNFNNSYDRAVTEVDCVRAANTAYSLIRAYSGGFADTEFNLRGDGNAFADGTWTGGGADYAEYFEWSDGNLDTEDRRGISVVLVGDKIREAVVGEDPIGVISGNPSVVGDAAWNKWSGKYLRDEFGSYLLDANGDRQLNPSYDPDQEYIPREQRTEWDCVGLMGKLRIRKGQVTGSRWIKMRDINDSVEEWLVR